MTQRGLTLIELLIVIVIIGILTTVGFVNLLNAQHSTLVHQASTELAANLRTARSDAQRYDENVRFALPENPATSYILTYGTINRQVELPQGTQLKVVAGSSSVTYNAPFGETDAVNREYQVRLARPGSSPTMYIKLVGITGKVVQSEQP